MRCTAMLIILSLTVACQFPETEQYEVTTIALPEGDESAGREAFLKMGCASCHRVAWDRGLPEPASGSLGPDLSVRLSERTAGVVATSIIAPSHYVSPLTIEMTEDETSPMRDFNAVMSVRQLIDIVAYLRSGDPHAAQAEPAETP